jgi:putative CRISPR-associated protein (TIGR02619 family)
VNLLIISTCGTSILANHLDDEKRKWFKGVSKLLESEASKEDKRRLDELQEEVKSKLKGMDDTELCKSSAELNGILSILKEPEYKGAHKPVLHYLIQTSTLAGKRTAEIVKQVLEARGMTVVSVLSPSDLHVSSQDRFLSGLSELTRDIRKTVKDYKDQKYEIVFNLTGGWKSLNSYLQALGMLYECTCAYIYEEVDSALIKIPRMPVKLAEDEEFRNNLEVFRKLHVGYELTRDYMKDVKEVLYYSAGDDIALTPWGEKAWSDSWRGLYKSELFSPLSPKLKFTDQAKKDAKRKDVTGDNRCNANHAFDTLSAYLDGIIKEMPVKFKFEKIIASNGYRRLRLWSDGSTGRAKLIENTEGVYEVVSIGDHEEDLP